MIKLLQTALASLKQDPFIYAPFIIYSLISGIIQRQFFSSQTTANPLDILYFFITNTLQSCVAISIILIIHKLKQDPYDFLQKNWKAHTFRYIKLAMLINVPLIIIQYLGLTTLNTTPNTDNNPILTLALVIALGYIIIPLTTWSYGALVTHTINNTPLMHSLKDAFKHYRKSLRFFTLIITLNLPQIFILPLYTTSFILKDALIASVQGIILTLITTSSYHFYTTTEKTPLKNV